MNQPPGRIRGVDVQPDYALPRAGPGREQHQQRNAPHAFKMVASAALLYFGKRLVLLALEWRNWQTHGTQNPATFTGHEGSTPSSSTSRYAPP